jgi:DNA-binding GntR family transcriptional regulator
MGKQTRLRARLRQHSDSETTAEAVYRVLRHGIIQGELAPGVRLRSDALAKELEVSRTPVREALRKLEAEGLVIHSGARLMVYAPSEQDLTELFFVREALEGMAARLAAENATPSEITELGELLDDMEAVRRRGDLPTLRSLTADFHQKICRTAHNDRLLQLLTSLLDSARKIKTSTLFGEGRAAEALREHRDLVAAIAARDGERAETLARAHRRRTLELRREMLRTQTRRSRAVVPKDE